MSKEVTGNAFWATFNLIIVLMHLSFLVFGIGAPVISIGCLLINGLAGGYFAKQLHRSLNPPALDYKDRWKDRDYIAMTHKTMALEKEELGESFTECHCPTHDRNTPVVVSKTKCPACKVPLDSDGWCSNGCAMKLEYSRPPLSRKPSNASDHSSYAGIRRYTRSCVSCGVTFYSTLFSQCFDCREQEEAEREARTKEIAKHVMFYPDGPKMVTELEMRNEFKRVRENDRKRREIEKKQLAEIDKIKATVTENEIRLHQLRNNMKGWR